MSVPIPPDQLGYYEKHADDTQQPNLIATIILCLALPINVKVIVRYPVVGYRFRNSMDQQRNLRLNARDAPNPLFDHRGEWPIPFQRN